MSSANTDGTPASNGISGGGSSLSSAQQGALVGVYNAFNPSNAAQAAAVQQVIAAFAGAK